MINNNIVSLTMDNGINVKVDKGNIKGVNKYELEDHISELFKFKKKYKSKELIELSSVCDCMWNLMFCSINKESREMSFKLC